ncbi:hypothetical protein MKW98_026684 [Papaver atlanticum]|uniref:Uncharacterized protein n=1 Tax=Papaver atlanticum TaxID=357466 RepID=A0AAD4X6M3_9MAGN|nr:hypothetical protein MKW98_026684 [Papaver atlanticum]
MRQFTSSVKLSGLLELLHYRVSDGEKEFAIERQAYNEATFRRPDENGWQPQQLPNMNMGGNYLHQLLM